MPEERELSDMDVRLIVTLTGRPLHLLSKEFGVSMDTIKQIQDNPPATPWVGDPDERFYIRHSETHMLARVYHNSTIAWTHNMARATMFYVRINAELEVWHVRKSKNKKNTDTDKLEVVSSRDIRKGDKMFGVYRVKSDGTHVFLHGSATHNEKLAREIAEERSQGLVTLSTGRIKRVRPMPHIYKPIEGDVARYFVG